MRSRVLTVLLVAAGVLAPLLSTTASAVPAKAGPYFHRPAIGACYDYGVRASNAGHAPRSEVPCDESHRAVVIAAPRFRGKVRDRTDPKIWDQVATRCYRALYEALGGTRKRRAMSAYDIAYYVPTRAELDKGARWVRCDLTLAGGSRLMALPDPLLPATRDDSTDLCLTRNQFPTVCSREHVYRAAGVIVVKGDAYPGDARLDLLGAKECASRTSTRRYAHVFGNEWTWEAGRREITCFNRTRQ